MRSFFSVAAIWIVLLAGCGIQTEQASNSASIFIDVESVPYSHMATLRDVTHGKTIRDISTGGTASGIASARNVGGAFEIKATFEQLPDPLGGDFYEGWLVRGAAREVVSTGRIENIDGTFQNSFMSAGSLGDDEIYIVTLEPNDDDPAPATHILEGNFVITR